MEIINLLRTEFFCCEKETLISFLKKYKPNQDINYIILLDQREIKGVYRLVDLMYLYYNQKPGNFKYELLKDIELTFEYLKNPMDSDCIFAHDADVLIVLDQNGTIVGVIDNLPVQKIIVSSFTQKYDSAKYSKSKFLLKIIEHFEEEIFVTDGEGNVLFINSASANTMGCTVDEVIGRNAADMQKDGIFSISSTLEVLKTGEKVDIVQVLKNGKELLTTGVPVFNSDGKIEMVISTSKDLDELNQLKQKLESHIEELAIKTEEINTLREEVFIKEGFISSSKAMENLKKMIVRIAPLDMSILIEGETGVGKGVMAKSIHRFSNRAKEPFIKINCGMIPENLMESEFFGYEAGAFTGAERKGKIGKVELANRGTLFLDEIGEMPASLQVKLLEFLQDKTITRVGGTKKIDVDVRIVAATNRDLDEMSKNGLFRQDLYYRINVLPIYIPSLRERVEDIEILAKYFLTQYNSKYRTTKKLSEDFIKTLRAYDWPGNIREFEHVLERLFVTVEGNLITSNDFDVNSQSHKAHAANVVCPDIIPLKKAKLEIEKQLVEKAYQVYHSTYKVAEALKIDQSTVVKLMKKHKLNNEKRNRSQ